MLSLNPEILALNAGENIIIASNILFNNSGLYSKDLVPVKLIPFKLPAACFLVRLVSFSECKLIKKGENSGTMILIGTS